MTPQDEDMIRRSLAIHPHWAMQLLLDEVDALRTEIATFREEIADLRGVRWGEDHFNDYMSH